MNLKDLKFEYFKSGGPGGQHKNKRFMAVRVTHLPTGLVAVGQEYRSQAQNKEAALKRLEVRWTQKYAKKKARIPTRVSRAAEEKRLRQKKAESRKKELRRKQIHWEE